MSVRETIDRHRGVMAGAAVLMIAGAIGVFFLNGESTSETLTTRSFYTTDEGKTWFVDTAEKAPPFDHEGKTAYRVRLFTCDGGKTKFAGYVERFTAEAQKRIEAAKRGDTEPKGRPVMSVIDEMLASGTEIKKPGAGNPWVLRSDLKAAPKITDVRGPNGELAEQVPP